jgi:hypothetical protein
VESSYLYETKEYGITITSDKDINDYRVLFKRDLGVYSIVNKKLGVIEASCNNLPMALSNMRTLQSYMDQEKEKEVKSAISIVPFTKDDPE